MNVFEKLRIIENRADLHYEDVSCDRRGFFKAMKNRAVRKALGLLDNTKRNEHKLSYSDKALPHRRELLNRSFSVLPGDMRKGVLEHYYYDIEVDETCNDCFACVGVCPTGALKSAEDESDATLFFNSSFCSGCGLCGSFCRSESIRPLRGFSGLLVFQFKDANEASDKGDSEAHRGSHVEGAFAD
jgi:Pyruvate/2-oxoacid:ferredoxin oxidoreductase delta subunit